MPNHFQLVPNYFYLGTNKLLSVFQMSMLATIRYELGYDKIRETKKPVLKSRKAMKAFQQHMKTVASLDI